MLTTTVKCCKIYIAVAIKRWGNKAGKQKIFLLVYARVEKFFERISKEKISKNEKSSWQAKAKVIRYISLTQTASQ